MTESRAVWVFRALGVPDLTEDPEIRLEAAADHIVRGVDHATVVEQDVTSEPVQQKLRLVAQDVVTSAIDLLDDGMLDRAIAGIDERGQCLRLLRDSAYGKPGFDGPVELIVAYSKYVIDRLSSFAAEHPFGVGSL